MMGRFFDFRKLVFQGSLFARLFLTLIFISVGLITLSGILFYDQAYQMLDTEADSRLLEEAQFLSRQLKSLSSEDEGFHVQTWLEGRFQSNLAIGWIQNVYWIDLQSEKPAFAALVSLGKNKESTLTPPSIEEIEDMIDDGMFSFEDNRPFFPDPFSLAGTRRYKIILYPILDSDGILESIVGLEADMQYLHLYIAMRKMIWNLVLFGTFAGVVISMLLAKSFSRKIDFILEDLKRVANHQNPGKTSLGIRELDTIRNGLIDLGNQIESQNHEIHSAFGQKLSELAFTGGAISHEIRNPLSAIELHLGLIKRRFSPSNTDLDSFREIENQLLSMKLLTDQFLKYSHKVSPQFGPVPLRQLVTELVDLKKQTFYDFDSTVSIPDELRLLADASMVKQIFENLINNSIEAKPEDLSISISAAETKEKKVQITVSDNGPGVPKDLLPRLFTPFATGRPAGHGIGLALVRKLVEAHNGRISCLPDKIDGAQFTLEFCTSDENTCC